MILGIAVFIYNEGINTFDANSELMKLIRNVDLNIKPHFIWFLWSPQEPIF
jgi:hypothetical protein